MHARITARRNNGGAGAGIPDWRPAPRGALQQDIPALLRLIQPLEENGALLPRKRQQLRSCIEDFYVIANGQNIICCAALHIHSDRQSGEIACVATCGHHRGRGYGSLLLQHIEQRARAAGLRQVFLRSAFAAGWFLRHGFSKENLALLPGYGPYSPPGRNSQILCKRLL